MPIGRAALSIVFFAALASAAPAQESARPIGDAERGSELWQQCVGCHQIGPDAENRIGPHLNGIFGRKAAAVEGFHYSEGLQRAGDDGLVWTLETLDAYIEDPRALVTRTRMAFRGMEDPEERADLLAWLREFSDSPANIPEAEPTALRQEVDLPEETLAIEGDPAFGEYLSSECTTCHQRDGSDQGIPGIRNWPEEDFVIAMHAYKQKIRPHPVMQMVTGRLSDEEIAALAAYFADLE